MFIKEHAHYSISFLARQVAMFPYLNLTSWLDLVSLVEHVKEQKKQVLNSEIIVHSRCQNRVRPQNLRYLQELVPLLFACSTWAFPSTF